VQNIVKFDALGLAIFTVQTTGQLIDQLNASIQALVDSGDLKSGLGKNLQNRVHAVERSLQKTPVRSSTACRQLGNLIGAIQDRVAHGDLSSENGASLIAQINDFMQKLGCAS